MQLRKQVGALAVAGGVVLAAGLPVSAGQAAAFDPPAASWRTVVNNTDTMPGGAAAAKFNSYNQPSVNRAGLVVIRARAKGGTGVPPPHGIYVRDMSGTGPIERVVDRTVPVPAPNNRGSTFIEYPSFPRIDPESGTYAFRGNSPPVWSFGDEGGETAGTTGVFANVDGTLVTGASKLGAVPEFPFYGVPGLPGGAFEVFPGAPSPTGSRIVFKGNFTDGAAARTGVFFRALTTAPFGGTSPVKAIATTGTTFIPGAQVKFGSLAPPSAALGWAAFAGFDDEAEPSLGGIYVAPLAPTTTLTPVVQIGSPVPSRDRMNGTHRFNDLSEAVSFDGRFVAFWGAWGADARSVVVTCPSEGNEARREFCREQNGGNPEYEFEVPTHQGVFVHDLETASTHLVAETGEEFVDFISWNFSGKVPGSPDGDDGEPARWRSSTFVASGGGARGGFRVAFKARTPQGATGVYFVAGSQAGIESRVTLIDTTLAGQRVDPTATPDSLVEEVGLERDAFRGEWLVVNAKLGAPEASEEAGTEASEEAGTEASEEAGTAGVYATRLPLPEEPSMLPPANEPATPGRAALAALRPATGGGSCAAVPARRDPGDRSRARFTVSRQQFLVSQRIYQAAIRRANAVQSWIDAGIESRDICGGALGVDRFLDSVGFVAADGERPTANPRPLEVASATRGDVSGVTVSRTQALINQRVAQAAIRRVNALRVRIEGALTGGDVKGATLTNGQLVPGLGFGTLQDTPKPAPSQTRIQARTGGSPGAVTLSATQARINQRIGQQAVLRVNALTDELKRGLVADNFAPASIGSTEVARP